MGKTYRWSVCRSFCTMKVWHTELHKIGCPLPADNMQILFISWNRYMGKTQEIVKSHWETYKGRIWAFELTLNIPLMKSLERIEIKFFQRIDNDYEILRETIFVSGKRYLMEHSDQTGCHVWRISMMSI
ncbi:MAG: hypothetical protein Ta2E_11610 [Mycoplasmoidaceae bacterium]|nr:MAG: hypothetical protein Ta2E_11610 [Mycoplasmoidaceae bacterium]